MGDDGTMAKGTKYTPEFKAKAVRLLAEYRASYFVGDERDRRGGEGAGVAPETLGRWRNQSDATVVAESKRSAEDAMAEFIGMLDDHMVWYRDKRIKTEFGMSIMDRRRRLGLAV